MHRLSNNFYKKLIHAIGLTSVLLIFALAGCGGGGGGNTVSTTQVTSGGVSCTTTINSGFIGDLNATYSPALTAGGGEGGSGGSGGSGSGGSGGGAGAGGGEGKVLGGLMTITRLADGKVLGAAITDTSIGLVTIAPCGSDLPVLLTLSGQAGAEYYDEGTEKLTPFPVGTTLHALVDQFDENVGVSFLTEGAYQYALSNMASAGGSLTGLTLAQVQLANQTTLTAINANLPAATKLISLKSLPTPIDSTSSANALPANRYGIAGTVVGGLVTAAAKAQPRSVAPALGLGTQLGADLTDGKINGLTITGAPAASGANVYYTPATLPAAALAGIAPVAQQFGATTIVPLLQPTVTISLSSPTIDVGQLSSLLWAANNATSCTATGDWSGTQATSGISSLSPTTTGTTTYVLTCTGPGGSASAQATLTVDASSTGLASVPVPTVSISANPTSITQGQSSTLTWTTSNATSCTANGSWSGTEAVNSTLTVSPTAAGSYTYGLTCTGAGGSATGQVVLTVAAPTPAPAVSISVSPVSITLGQSTTLSWSSTNSTSCTATGNWSGSQAVNGSSTVTPSAAGSATYGLTCTGAGGSASGQAMVAVTNPVSAPTATVSTLAGSGNGGSADGTGTAASFNSPKGIAADSAGNVYVGDMLNHIIRKVTPAGVVTTFAGNPGATGGADGGSAATFTYPIGIAVDSSGNVYVADEGNSTIRKITQAGIVSTLAGTANVTGSADGTGAAASFNQPTYLAIDGAGNLYVSDSGNRTIRKITPAGAVSTLAGTAGVIGSADGAGPAASFADPLGVAIDNSGNLYVADAAANPTKNNIIRKITPAGVVTTIAGTAGVTGSVDGTGAAASFNSPQGIAIDSAGNLYVADTGNYTIRMITPSGVVITLAGTAGVQGSTNGVGTAASFFGPSGIGIDSAGNLYVADTANDIIRKITLQ